MVVLILPPLTGIAADVAVAAAAGLLLIQAGGISLHLRAARSGLSG